MKPRSKFKKMAELYERGIINRAELNFQVLKTLTPGNVEELFREFPPEHMVELHARVDREPTDEAGWSRMRLFSSGAWTDPDAAEEQNRKLMVDHRRGVETFREFAKE
jgi:hypothetical protein